MEKIEKENGLTVNIANYTGEKPIEIVYREGAAQNHPIRLKSKSRKR